MISYLTQRTRQHKKRKKKTPTLLLCNSSLVSKVFKNRKRRVHFFVSARCTCLHVCTCGGVINLLSLLIVDKCPEGEIIIDGVETSNSSLMRKLIESEPTMFLNKQQIRCVCKRCSLVLFVCCLKFIEHQGSFFNCNQRVLYKTSFCRMALKLISYVTFLSCKSIYALTLSELKIH